MPHRLQESTLYSGENVIKLKKQASTPAAPAADILQYHVEAGTTAGTLKLVLRAGAAGPQIVLLDDIPQSGGASELLRVLRAVLADGSAAVPTYSFDLDRDLGLYRVAANRAGFAGSLRADAAFERSTQSLVFAASLTPNAITGEHVFVGALTANITINAPTNPIGGQELKFYFLQDATGGRTVTWNAVFIHSWSDIGNTLNRRASIHFVFDGTSWLQVGALRAWA